MSPNSETLPTPLAGVRLGNRGCLATNVWTSPIRRHWIPCGCSGVSCIVGGPRPALQVLHENHAIPASDPVEAIEFLMEQKSLSRKDLEPYIGTSGRVSEVLSRKRSLSLTMIKKLHEGLKIPYECLINH